MKKIGLVLGVIFAAVFGGVIVGIIVGVVVGPKETNNTDVDFIANESPYLPQVYSDVGLERTNDSTETPMVTTPSPINPLGEESLLLENMIIGKWRWGVIDGSGSGSAVNGGYYVVWEGESGSTEFFSNGTYTTTAESGLSATGTYRVDNSIIIATQSGFSMSEIVTIIDNNSFTSVSDLFAATYYYERME